MLGAGRWGLFILINDSSTLSNELYHVLIGSGRNMWPGSARAAVGGGSEWGAGARRGSYHSHAQSLLPGRGNSITQLIRVKSSPSARSARHCAQLGRHYYTPPARPLHGPCTARPRAIAFIKHSTIACLYATEFMTENRSAKKQSVAVAGFMFL